VSGPILIPAAQEKRCITPSRRLSSASGQGPARGFRHSSASGVEGLAVGPRAADVGAGGGPATAAPSIARRAGRPLAASGVPFWAPARVARARAQNHLRPRRRRLRRPVRRARPEPHAVPTRAADLSGGHSPPAPTRRESTASTATANLCTPIPDPPNRPDFPRPILHGPVHYRHPPAARWRAAITNYDPDRCLQATRRGLSARCSPAGR